MELTLYDIGGQPVAYCDDGRVLYAFSGAPLAYLDGDSVYAFRGSHLGWWDRGWVHDHQGAWVFFTDATTSVGPRRPPTQPRPTKGPKRAVPSIGYKLSRPERPVDAQGWSLRSGAQFFQPSR